LKKVLITLFALALAVLIAVPAVAVPPILAGNAAIERTLPDLRTNFYLVDTNRPFAFDCAVTGWNIFADASVPVGFMVYRLTGSTWSVVYDGSGTADLKIPAVGLNSYSFSSPILVKAGDYVGLYSGSGAGAVSFDWGGSNIHYTFAGGGPLDWDNVSPRTYSVNAVGVNYGISGLLSPYAAPPKTFKIGSVIPLKWQYSLLESVVDSSASNPSVEIKLIAAGGSGNETPIEVNDPGSSGLRYDSLTMTWQFNWQTKGLTAGVYNIYIQSDQFGPSGPFPIQLR